MSDTTTAAASTESEIPEGMVFHGESATPEEQPPVEAQTSEAPVEEQTEDATPQTSVTPDQTDSKPESNDTDSKAAIAARNLAIENRKLKREAREREEAASQAQIQKVEPDATPTTEVPEDLLYDQNKNR